ncbi:MAG: hypothetical protein KJ063_25390 [Anaerolineae bacterium]|nr:hypothetical protein [Anaerolineae bacterium]
MKQSPFSIRVIEGEGYYDQRIQLFFNGTRKIKIFDYLIYRLFHFENGELQLNLNFGGNKYLPHAVKRLDGMLLLVPRFLDTRLTSDNIGLPGLDWREYLEIIAPQLYIFPEWDWTNLWTSLDYPVEELSKIAMATSEDIFLLWLLSSDFHPSLPLVSFIPEYAKALASSILTEHPEHSLSVKEVVQMALNKEISLNTTSCKKATDGFVIKAYWLDKEGSIKDWNALFVNNNGDTGVLLNDLFVKLTIIG